MVLQSLRSPLTANAYPAGTDEFSFGERRQEPLGVLTPLNPEGNPEKEDLLRVPSWEWRTILELRRLGSLRRSSCTIGVGRRGPMCLASSELPSGGPGETQL
jgi:hypothetical protein